LLTTPNPKKRKFAPEMKKAGKLNNFPESSSSSGQPLSPLKPKGNRTHLLEDDGLEMMSIPTSDVDETELDTNVNLSDPRRQYRAFNADFDI
jgi:E3 ubiquitin-protein ligase RAD18